MPGRLPYITLHLDGSAYTEDYRTREEWYLPCTAVFHPAGETHQGHTVGDDVLHLFHIELDPSHLTGLTDEHGLSELRAGDLVWKALGMYREFTVADTCTPLAVEALVGELLASAQTDRHSLRPPTWLGAVADRLHDEWQGHHTVDHLARTAGVHPVHLSRVFRQYYRTSPGQYLRRLRIQAACRMLQTPGPGLADIALATGFADQSQFTRAFKRVTGTSPAAFRSAITRPTLGQPASVR